jgi:hypothetical protein
MLTKIINWYKTKKLVSKINSSQELTPIELLQVMSNRNISNDLVRNKTITVNLPCQVIINGLEDLQFTNSIRILSRQHLAISSEKDSSLMFNCDQLRSNERISCDEINGMAERIKEGNTLLADKLLCSSKMNDCINDSLLAFNKGN